MFSYGSNKNSQTTLQNALIQEIQFLANQIFEPHSVSVPRTELQEASLQRTQIQEMSLQLSPATSEQGDHQAKQYQQQQPPNYYTNIVQDKKPFERSLSQKTHSFVISKQPQFEQKETKRVYKKSQIQKDFHHQFKNQQGHDNRLTKSMISSNHFKEPGSFSNNYLQVKNTTQCSQIGFKSKNQQKLEQKPLLASNLNKSNILKGLLNQKSEKKNHKKGKFSQSYSSNYISPYSTRGIKQNPKSYMQKSISQKKKSKQSIQIQYIKQKINENIEPQVSHRLQKLSKSKSKNKKLSHVKSKYRQTRSIMHSYQLYADQHIYKKIKQEMSPLYEKNKQYSLLSQQQIQNNWKRFIENEQNFIEYKKQWIASKKIQKYEQQRRQLYHTNAYRLYQSDINSVLSSNPHKMTPQDFVKKYKREKDKLKQKLQTFQITNFVDKTYADSNKYDTQMKSSNQKNSTIKSQQLQDMSIIKENKQDGEEKIVKLLIENTKSERKNRHQNFFISVGTEKQFQILRNQNSNLKKQIKNQEQRQSNYLKPLQRVLAQSSIYQEKSKSSRKKLPSSRNQKSNTKSPFNSKKVVENQKSIKKNEKQIKQLTNPKYFKSIDELQQYSSNSRQKQKRTLLHQSKIIVPSLEKSNLIKINHKKISQNISIKPVLNEQKGKKSKGKFDQHLMNQIIEDLNQMRSQIEQNKKNRKYKIQNYSNFTNLRRQKRQSVIDQQTGSFKFDQPSSHAQFNTYKEEIHQNNVYRMNNHLHPEDRNTPSRISLHKFNNSRSISPIEQENSILQTSQRQSPSTIFSYDQNSRMRNVNFSGQLDNSNIILVKSRQEMQFMFGNQ